MTNETGGGSNLIFNYSAGFAGAEGKFNVVDAASQFVNGVMQVLTGTVGQHEAGAVWYRQLVDITAFTTTFAFKLPKTVTVPSILGMTFCIQNSTPATNPADQFGAHSGISAGADANLSGYGAFSSNASPGVGNSVAIKFDVSASSGGQFPYPPGSAPSLTGLYLNGGPFAGLVPQEDLNPDGINLNLGNLMSCAVTYDGALLTMVLTDTVTNASCRRSWPINIPAVVGGNLGLIGFTAGEIPTGVVEVTGWTFCDGSAGRFSRPATPTASVAPGQYATMQSVALSGPIGSAVHYTTNGLQPTSASLLYTGTPIVVSHSQVIQAVAIQSGFTDSLVACFNYQIAPAGASLINFPTGFAANNGILQLNGSAVLTGSVISLTEAASNRQRDIASVWSSVPVPVAAFTADFTAVFGKGGGGGGTGITFCVQNQLPAALNGGGNTLTASRLYVSGGPHALGNDQNGMGYSGSTGNLGSTAGIYTSVAVKLDPLNNTTGIYTDGALVTTPQTSITGLSLNSGHPIAVHLSYDGTTLSVSITDTVTLAKFNVSFAVDIPHVVHGTIAYVGFTAAQFFSALDQSITSFTFKEASMATVFPPLVKGFTFTIATVDTAGNPLPTGEAESAATIGIRLDGDTTHGAGNYQFIVPVPAGVSAVTPDMIAAALGKPLPPGNYWAAVDQTDSLNGSLATSVFTAEVPFSILQPVVQPASPTGFTAA